MSSNNFNHEQTDIKIIEPIKNYLKEFKTVDEFNLWYNKNKDEIDSLTTHKLNKMYHIDGYRITKIKGKLCLKKFEDKTINSVKGSLTPDSKNTSGVESFGRSQVNVSNEKQHHDIINEISLMKEEIETLKKTINEIINIINNN